MHSKFHGVLAATIALLTLAAACKDQHPHRAGTSTDTGAENEQIELCSDIGKAREQCVPLLWIHQFSGSGYATGRGVAALPDGAIAVTGRFMGEVAFGDRGNNETRLTTESNDTDVFVGRYLANGELAWIKHVSGPEWADTDGIAAHPDGSVVVIGEVGGPATFGEGEPGEVSLEPSGGGGATFVAKYKPNGELDWVKHADLARPSDVAVSEDGDVLVTGDFTETLTFGAGTSGETTLVATTMNTSTPGLVKVGPGPRDVFVAKYNSGGRLEWARRAGGALAGDSGGAVAALPDGSAVVTGNSSRLATFGSSGGSGISRSRNSNGPFLAKYDPTGSVLWVRNAGGRAISVLPTGDIVATGHHRGIRENNNESSSTTRPAAQSLVARYDGQGNLLWNRAVIGERSYEGSGIAALGTGATLVIGIFGGEATFDTNEGLGVTLYGLTEHDVFLAKYESGGGLAWAVRLGSGLYEVDPGIRRQFPSLTRLDDGSVAVTGAIRGGRLGDRSRTVLLVDGFFIAKLKP